MVRAASSGVDVRRLVASRVRLREARIMWFGPRGGSEVDLDLDLLWLSMLVSTDVLLQRAAFV